MGTMNHPQQSDHNTFDCGPMKLAVVDLEEEDMEFTRQRHALMVLTASTALTSAEKGKSLKIGVRDFPPIALVKKAFQALEVCVSP